MKKILITVILTCFAIISSAQMPAINACLGTDVTACQGQAVQINDCTPGGNVVGGITLTAPTSLNLTDDVWSSTVNIGFNFSFYGSNYSQCIVGSNGLVSFNIANASGYCPYSFSVGNTLPNASVTGAFNSIMLAYQDQNPSGMTNAIQYQTIGTAPNRKFIVLYNSVDGFSCGPTACTYAGLILYETTNVIEIFIGNKGICSGWNNGLAYEGIENAAGTNAVMIAGRNCSQWSANQDGQRFTPTTPANTNNYVNTAIPYVFINTVLNNTTMWASTTGQVFPYNNGVLNVTQVSAGPIGYFLSGTACGNAIGSISDTSFVTIESVSVSASMTADVCNSGVGTVTATPLSGASPYTFMWPTLGNQTTSTVNNVSPGTYQVIMTSSTGCQANASTTVTTSTASFTGSTTQVSCQNGTDGTATANMSPSLGILTYLWDDPMAQTTQTAIGLSAGTYTCNITSSIGCNGTVTLTVTEIPPMISTIASFTDVNCNSMSNGIITINTTDGTAPYTYNWDNSTSISNTASDLPAGLQTIIVQDANGCTKTLTQMISEPLPLSFTNLSPSIIDTICPLNSDLLSVSGTGGSSAYTYTWTENSNNIGTGSTITVTPLNSGTQYCVTLSEACGSPTTDTCLTINFPTAIIPSIIPNTLKGCAPAKFEFLNNSNLANQIANTHFDFGDKNNINKIGIDSASNTYIEPGSYTLNIDITSIYGCVYSKTFQDLITVSPIPNADFFINPNPTTIFETKVNIQDRSSDDVLNWAWYSPYSAPSISSDQNPTFKFEEGTVGVYPIHLTVTNESGCIDSTIIYLNVVSDILFYAPNTFTPNGDEFNQKWIFYTAGIDNFDFNLTIFNRWGQTIFETNDPQVGWDGTFQGKIVSDGTYSWRAILKDLYTDDKKLLYGSVNVIK
ncbi:MAG: gliding motility-associated C-terminal domain-containing protein [Flavobacteriia bacterium]|nr:gliding motility-associated C-terminal domain-containing protein [Flavobacteriia bacterium]